MDLPNPLIELGSPSLLVDSLPTELSGKPHIYRNTDQYKVGIKKREKRNKKSKYLEILGTASASEFLVNFIIYIYK